MKNKISNLEFSIFTFFIMRSCLLGITSHSMLSIANQDAWISMIIGTIVGFIPILLIIYIMNYKPDLNILEKNKVLFGNLFGTIINTILTGLFLSMSLIIFYNLNIFIVSQYLNKTPLMVVAIVFFITLLYISLKGLKVIARTFLMLFYTTIILYITTSIGLFSIFSFDNLKPFFEADTNSLIYSAFVYLSYTILPVFLLTMIPKNNIKNNKQLPKYLIITYLIANLSLINVFTLTIGVLGINLSKIFEYPEFHVLESISFLGVKSRFDSIVAMHWIFDMLCFISLSLYFLKEYIKSTLKFNNNFVICTIGLLLITIPQKYIWNITLLDNLSKNLFPIIISIIIGITILLLSLLIKKSTKCLKKTKYKEQNQLQQL